MQALSFVLCLFIRFSFYQRIRQVKHQAETSCRFRNEAAHWKDQYARLEKTCQLCEDHFLRVEQERYRLSDARLDEAGLKQLSVRSLPTTSHCCMVKNQMQDKSTERESTRTAILVQGSSHQCLRSANLYTGRHRTIKTPRTASIQNRRGKCSLDRSHQVIQAPKVAVKTNIHQSTESSTSLSKHTKDSRHCIRKTKIFLMVLKCLMTALIVTRLKTST
jgi:hypothetical protein